ncbi:MAG: apolipoprotein N-acyltransferase [Moorea sp. SIO2B7]|nr:apolipoprotein N-acyltransferase [Moorena sp. SIO2B7]
MGLTPAPVEAWYLAWVALVPLWILIIKNNNLISFKKNILIALAWGFGYHGLALFWITGIHPMTWMGVPWLASIMIAIFCWLFITFWGATLVVIWSILISLYEKINFKITETKKNIIRDSILTNALLRVLIGVAIWCILEGIWSAGPLWWSSLSYTQSPHNLVILQLSKISGFSTITASIVAVNGLIAEAIMAVISKHKNQQNNKNIFFAFPLFFCIILHLLGWYLYNHTFTYIKDNALKIGIIQGNIPNEIKLYPAGWRKALEGYTTGYKTLANQGVDVILTPETALPFFWDYLVNNSSFYEAIIDKKVSAWVGAFGKQERSFTNSLFTVTGKGKIFSEYDKIKLVPLGEYIPFEQILGRIINRLSPLDAHLAAGKPNQIFDTPFGRAIVGICYESAFSQHFRRQAAQGGEFIITASNNAHYSNTMPAQHHAQDVMRAIETDRWAARATNTGYSAIVDPRGKTIWISDINTYELHTDTIYRRQTQTLYVKWGDWLTWFLLILGLSSWLFILSDTKN